jgi:hypothetical protein
VRGGLLALARERGVRDRSQFADHGRQQRAALAREHELPAADRAQQRLESAQELRGRLELDRRRIAAQPVRVTELAVEVRAGAVWVDAKRSS